MSNSIPLTEAVSNRNYQFRIEKGIPIVVSSPTGLRALLAKFYKPKNMRFAQVSAALVKHLEDQPNTEFALQLAGRFSTHYRVVDKLRNLTVQAIFNNYKQEGYSIQSVKNMLKNSNPNAVLKFFSAQANRLRREEEKVKLWRDLGLMLEDIGHLKEAGKCYSEEQKLLKQIHSGNKRHPQIVELEKRRRQLSDLQAHWMIT